MALCTFSASQLLYASPAGVILLFCLTRVLCSRYNVANFNKASEAAKLIYVTHWAFFLIFMTTTIPYSIAMVKVLFSPNNVLELVKPSTFRSITFPVAFQLCMYVYEVSAQSCSQLLLHVALSTEQRLKVQSRFNYSSKAALNTQSRLKTHARLPAF